MRSGTNAYNPLPYLFALAMTFSSSLSFAGKSAVTVLNEQNYRVLSGRVYEMLRYRLANLDKCSSEARTELSNQFQKLAKYSADRGQVIQTVNLYLQSFSAGTGCKPTLDANERNFYKRERSKFAAIRQTIDSTCRSVTQMGSALQKHDCPTRVQQFVADMDPHCVSIQVPYRPKEYDPFPCMSGDYLTGRSLVANSNWRDFLTTESQFLSRLRAAVAQPMAQQSGVDLWELYKDSRNDTPALRERFLASINFYFSSYHSMSSYLRGFHDHIWAFVLFKSGSAETAVDYFARSRLLVDEFRTIQKTVKKNKIPLRLGAISMQGKIRHDYMAAYLACHYRREHRLLHNRLPILLGIAYETLDFKSHIQSKVSLEKSRENFIKDTNRYRSGADWGYRFCQVK